MKTSFSLRVRSSSMFDPFVLATLTLLFSYHSIIEEIAAQVAEKESTLMARVEQFEATNSLKRNLSEMSALDVSEEAVQTLQSLATFHSALEKLDIFVRFLEQISEMYANLFVSKSGRTINADSLLTYVCRHIILAKVENLHAEVGFTEEFAKDEHLLRGKSGYALVTMQASLHILNDCSDYGDLFLQEDEVVDKIKIHR